jgi:hypothetical protein
MCKPSTRLHILIYRSGKHHLPHIAPEKRFGNFTIPILSLFFKEEQANPLVSHYVTEINTDKSTVFGQVMKKWSYNGCIRHLSKLLEHNDELIMFSLFLRRSSFLSFFQGIYMFWSGQTEFFPKKEGCAIAILEVSIDKFG